MSLLLSALCLLTPPGARAQWVAGPGLAALQEVREAGQSLKERLKPFQLDPKLARRLFDHALKYGEPVGSIECAECTVFLVKRERTAADGSTETVSLKATELPYEEPARETESGLFVRNLVLRRLFDNKITVESRRAVPQPGGHAEVDIWVYTVSTDGVLLEVEHRLHAAVRLTPVTIGGMGDAIVGETYGIIKTTDRTYKMSPRDPWVLNRWKTLSRELLKIFPTVEA